MRGIEYSTDSQKEIETFYKQWEFAPRSLQVLGVEQAAVQWLHIYNYPKLVLECEAHLVIEEMLKGCESADIALFHHGWPVAEVSFSWVGILTSNIKDDLEIVVRARPAEANNIYNLEKMIGYEKAAHALWSSKQIAGECSQFNYDFKKVNRNKQMIFLLKFMFFSQLCTSQIFFYAKREDAYELSYLQARTSQTLAHYSAAKDWVSTSEIMSLYCSIAQRINSYQ